MLTAEKVGEHEPTERSAAGKSAASKLYDIFTPRERMRIFILLLLSVVSALAQAFGVVAVFPFINVVMNPEVIHTNRILETLYQWGNFETDTSFMVFLGVGVFVAVVFSNLIASAAIWANTHFVMYKNHTLSKRLLTVYLSKPYEYFLQKNTNELGMNILAEVHQLTNLYLMSIFDLIVHGSILIVLVGMLLLVDAPITIGAIVFLGGSYGLLNLIIKRKLKASGIERLKANEERYRLADEALSSIKTTKVTGNESYFINHYSEQSKRFAKHNVFASISGELPKYILEAVAFGGIVFFIVYKILSGDQIGDLIPLVSLFAFAGYRMMPALHHLYKGVVKLYFNQAILDKLYRDMAAQQQTESGSALPLEIMPAQTGTKENLTLNHRILLSDIEFGYVDSANNVIDNLTISIEKNTSIGVVGSTGSGKTTLVDIILGLLVPDEGQILVDDTRINNENRRAWQQMIGYVPQEIYLSDNTIRNNIAFGVPEAEIDDQQVQFAARIAALDDFIQQELPERYDTRIGERGVRLSGGQRQRIGLARALYRNPEVLVLDEATSSLDGSTEETVLKAIQNASEARTVIMIAHRLNTLKDCDQIYLMENGKITGQGTYEELIHHNRIFMKMAKVSD